jgi:hypothetical protein
MPFSILLALLPLGAYLMMIGGVRLAGRVMVTTGGRDTFALGIGLSGLAAVGPGELFFPSAAGASFGPAVWPMLAILYFLLVSLVILNSRSRLVVYGLGDKALIEPLLRACRSIDPTCRVDESAGTVALPELGIHLRVVSHRGSDSADIEAYESDVSPKFWRMLLTQLRRETATVPAAAPGFGGALSIAGLLMLGVVGLQLIQQPSLVVQGLRDWLWR